MAYKRISPIPVAEGGAGAATLTGVLTGNGTSAFTASAVTDNTVLMGSTSNLVQDSTILVTDAGEMTNPSQPAFLGFLPSNDNDVTGDGTQAVLGAGVALTEVYDQGGDFTTAGVFTAPVTGRYNLTGSIRFKGIVAGLTTAFFFFNTSNGSYSSPLFNPVPITVAGDNTGGTAANVDMDAADTADYKISVLGGAKVVDLVSTGRDCNFSGFLIC